MIRHWFLLLVLGGLLIGCSQQHSTTTTTFESITFTHSDSLEYQFIPSTGSSTNLQGISHDAAVNSTLVANVIQNLLPVRSKTPSCSPNTSDKLHLVFMNKGQTLIVGTVELSGCHYWYFDYQPHIAYVTQGTLFWSLLSESVGQPLPPLPDK